MRDAVAVLWLLLRLAVGSIVSHRVKSAIVGSILVGGALFFTVGDALITSIVSNMERNLTGSLAGHLHAYSANAKDTLTLFQPASQGVLDVGEIPDADGLAARLERLPDVAAVVPMGTHLGAVAAGNEIDESLAAVRKAVRDGTPDDRRATVGRLRRKLDLLAGEVDNRIKLADDKTDLESRRHDLEAARTDAFWTAFERDPNGMLDKLDNRVAPLALDGRTLYFRFVGVDFDKYTRAFPQFQVVRGEPARPGERVLYISTFIYEEIVKNRVARLLDKIRDAVERDGRRIAGGGEPAEMVSRMKRRVPSLLYQMGPDDEAAIAKAIDAAFGADPRPVAARLEALLDVTDANVAAVHDFFYKHIAPRIRLYDLPVGQSLVLRSFTKQGYSRAVTVRLAGVFKFRGFEDTSIAGAYNIVDIETFRELYGRMTPEMRAELAAMRRDIDVQTTTRDRVEDDLFGAAPAPAAVAPAAAPVEAPTAPPKAAPETVAGRTESVPAPDAPSPALQLAIVLKNPRRIAAAKAAVAAEAAAAGVPLRVMTWEEATGILGQFIFVVRLILYIAVGVLGLVAIVIINSAVVTATLERVREIGTLRALGARRTFVLAMFLTETMLLAVGAGLLGMAAGALVVQSIGWFGIWAWSDVTRFLFSGPVLRPSVADTSPLVGVVTVLIVSLAAALWPALVATSVAPLTAMHSEE